MKKKLKGNIVKFLRWALNHLEPESKFVNYTVFTETPQILSADTMVSLGLISERDGKYLEFATADVKNKLIRFALSQDLFSISHKEIPGPYGKTMVITAKMAIMSKEYIKRAGGH